MARRLYRKARVLLMYDIDGQPITHERLTRMRKNKDTILMPFGNKLFATRCGAVWRYGIYTY